MGKRGRAIYFGALRMVADGIEKVIPRALILDFGDTRSLEVAVNSGFGEFDLGDDDVAVVLDGKQAPAKQG